MFLQAVVGALVLGSVLSENTFPVPVQPHSYDLSFYIDLNQEYVVGKVEIQFNPKEDVMPYNNSIELDCEGINVTKLTLLEYDEDKGATGMMALKQNKYVIKPSVQLFPSIKYTLVLQFNTKFNNQPYGLYSSNYPFGGSVVATNLKPNHARKVFPCFDDPSLLATFKLTIVYDSKWTAYSGTDVRTKTTDVNHGLTTVVFDTTKKISTSNLMFFFVHGYEVKETTNSRFSLHVPSKAVMTVITNTLFVNVLDSDAYSGLASASGIGKPKVVMVHGLPQVAINYYGVIAMRPEAMKLELGLSTLEQYQKCSTYLTAMAGLYYGSSLSPPSPRDAWLAESPAIFLQTVAMKKLAYWDDELIKALESEMIDAGRVDDPISALANDTKTVQFSTQKGATFLKMLDSVVALRKGTETMEDFLISYFNKTVYTVADTEQFLSQLATTLNLSDIDLKTWVYSRGYPILTVTAGDTNQEVNIQVQSSEPNEVNGWYVPVIYSTPKSTHLLEVVSKPASLHDVTDWIVIDPDNTGLYQVTYDTALVDRFAVLPDNSSTELRASAMRIAFFSSNQEQTDYNSALTTTNRLVNEYDYSPWHFASEGFINLRNLIFHQKDLINDFEMAVRTLADGRYGYFGLQMKNATASYANVGRQQAVQFACTYGHVVCRQQTRQLFKEMQEASPTKLQDIIAENGNDIMETVNCMGVMELPQAKWEKYFEEKYVKANSQRDKEKALKALACTQASPITKKYLRMANNGAKVNQDDKFKAIAAIYSRPENVDDVLTFFRNNMKTIGDLNDWVGVFKGIAPMLSTADQVDMLNNISAKLVPNSDIRREVDRAAETTRANIGHLERSKQSIRHWVDHDKPDPPHPKTTVKPSSSTTSNGTAPTGPTPTEPTPTGPTPTGPTPTPSTASPSTNTTTATTPTPTTTKPGGNGAASLLPTVLVLVGPALLAHAYRLL